MMVLALKHRSGLISQTRRDELLLQHMRDVKLGFTRPHEEDEEGEEVLSEDMLLTAEEAAVLSRFRAMDEEKLMIYSCDDVYRQRILSQNQALSVYALNDPENVLNTLSIAHIPPYDAQLHLGIHVQSLQLNMAAGEVANLVNSHISEVRS